MPKYYLSARIIYLFLLIEFPSLIYTRFSCWADVNIKYLIWKTILWVGFAKGTYKYIYVAIKRATFTAKQLFIAFIDIIREIHSLA